MSSGELIWNRCCSCRTRINVGKVTPGLHIVSRLLSWMNERYAHTCYFPLSNKMQWMNPPPLSLSWRTVTCGVLGTTWELRKRRHFLEMILCFAVIVFIHLGVITWSLLSYIEDLKFEQWSGRFLGWDPSVCKSNWLHVDNLRFSFMKLGFTLQIPLKQSVIFLQSWSSTAYFSNSTGSPPS